MLAIYIQSLVCLVSHIFDRVYCFLFDQFSFNFNKASYVVLKLSARHICVSQLLVSWHSKCLLGYIRHVGSLTQLAYVSIIATLCVLY